MESIGFSIAAFISEMSDLNRGTGRTTKMIEDAKDGDVIIFSNSREANHVHFECAMKGIKVRCIVFPVSESKNLFSLRNGLESHTRLYFDHSWLEEFYERAINGARKLIDSIETRD